MRHHTGALGAATSAEHAASGCAGERCGLGQAVEALDGGVRMRGGAVPVANVAAHGARGRSRSALASIDGNPPGAEPHWGRLRVIGAGY